MEEPVNPRLPGADAWDKQTGVEPVISVPVRAIWKPVSDDMAHVELYIRLEDHWHPLSYQFIAVARVKKQSRRGDHYIEVPDLTLVSLLKSYLTAAGAEVIGWGQRAGAGQKIDADKLFLYDNVVTLGARLSVGFEYLTNGTVRVIPIH